VEAGGPASAAAVLVVDDDPQVRDLLGAMLSREGYRVLHAANGREAMARARKELPAAILLDIMMPQVDGWTVLSELKEDEKLASIPVIIVSMLDERPLGLSLGAAEFLTKPVDRGKLMATLAQHIVHPAGTALIVEDQEADRASLSHILAAAGMTVAEAVNGRAALEWLENHAPPALMVLDIMMPELDGFAVLDAVRRDERLSKLPVIILTAKDLTASELEYLRGRGGIVIHKGPDARETLLGALRTQVADVVH
jgi:CheY-like chemotaxis protein